MIVFMAPKKTPKKTDEPVEAWPDSPQEWDELLIRLRYPVLDDRVGTVIDMSSVVSIGEANGEYCAVVIGGMSQPVIAQLIPRRAENDDPLIAVQGLVASVRQDFLRFQRAYSAAGYGSY